MMKKSLLSDRYLMIRTVENELRVQALERLKAPSSVLESDRDLLKRRYEEIEDRGLKKEKFKEVVLVHIHDRLDRELEDLTASACSGCNNVDHNMEEDSYKCKKGYKDTVNPGLCVDFDPTCENTENIVLINRNFSILEIRQKIKEIEQW